MIRARVSGLGWVTPGGLGCGRERPGFALGSGRLGRVTRKAVFAAPDQRFGRLDDFSRLGLAGVTFALRDAGLEAWTARRPVGLLAATEHGCLRTDAEYFATVLPEGGRLTSPHLFAYTLPSCFLGEAAIRFGLTGPSFVITDADPAGLAAFVHALELLADGEAETVVAGVCNLAGPWPGELAARVSPGAVFAVLTAAAAPPGYGELALSPAGTLTIAGVPIDSVTALVAGCLRPTLTPSAAPAPARPPRRTP